jgi:hypothetical protein
MGKSYSIKKRTKGFWFFSHAVLDIEVLVFNGKIRFLLEKILQTFFSMIPEIRYIKTEKPVVSGLRGALKSPMKGSNNEHHDLIVLKGYINNEKTSEKSEGEDAVQFSHIISSSFDSFDTEKNTIVYRLTSNIFPEFTSFKERVSMIDTVRNAAFVLEDCTVSVEKFLLSNVISRWCKIPTIDLSIHVFITNSIMNLRIEFDPLLEEEDLQILISLLKVISEYLLSNGEESFHPLEVLKKAKNKRN